VISEPLTLQPPTGLEGSDNKPINVMIVEWQQPGPPVEPEQAEG
jgi:hypothetical protein